MSTSVHNIREYVLIYRLCLRRRSQNGLMAEKEIGKLIWRGMLVQHFFQVCFALMSKDISTFFDRRINQEWKTVKTKYVTSQGDSLNCFNLQTSCSTSCLYGVIKVGLLSLRIFIKLNCNSVPLVFIIIILF